MRGINKENDFQAVSKFKEQMFHHEIFQGDLSTKPTKGAVESLDFKQGL